MFPLWFVKSLHRSRLNVKCCACIVNVSPAKVVVLRVNYLYLECCVTGQKKCIKKKMYAYMYIGMRVCVHLGMHAFLSVCKHVCVHVGMH